MPALQLCYSCVAEWSPADPDDDEVWDSSRWEWKKTASRLHCKWEWPHSYTPWQVPGERKTIPYHYLVLEKTSSPSVMKRNATYRGLREVPVKSCFRGEQHAEVSVCPFPDHQWLTQVRAAVPGRCRAPAHPELRERRSGAAAVPPVLAAQPQGKHSPASPGLCHCTFLSLTPPLPMAHFSAYISFSVG